MPSEPETAKPAPRSRPGRLRLRHLVILLVLLLPSGLALRRLAAVVPYPWLLVYAIGISVCTYALYGADKDSAADPASHWRAPEKLLHALELAGGWPGAFLAQRRLRHKSAKISYQLVFWLIVALHVGVATDYVRGWRTTRAIWERVVHPARPGSQAAP
jgi:uncharacterized membrane protein YsdA (DUF1294 family)